MSDPAPAKPDRPAEEPYPPIGYSWYVVAVLMVIYVFSFIDRQILNLLVDPIKRDLGISEKQMSYLMGLSFAIFYTFMGMPLGRLADSRSRRGLIAAGLIIWSFMTATCGLAKKYWQFFLMRMGVGVGEAALSPAAYSMITDYFPREKLATAISVYSMGIYLGGGLASILTAKVIRWSSGQATWNLPIAGEIHSWQLVFFAVGLPGILLSLLLLTIKEPVRRGQLTLQGKPRPKATVGEVGAYLKRNWKTIACHNLGFSLLSFSGYGSSAWIPTHFIRNHGWTASEAGEVFGWMTMIGGTAGIVTGGWLADLMAKRGVADSKMRVGLLVSLAWLPAGLFYTLIDDSRVAACIMFFAIFTASMPFGVAPAAIQEMMPNAMRAQASAIYLFVVNLIGLGIGPTAVAWVTEDIFGYPHAVGLSLVIVATVAHLLSALLLAVGLKPFRESMACLKDWTAKNA